MAWKLSNRIFILALFTGIILYSCEDGDGVATSVSGVYSCIESSAQSGTRKYLVEIDSVQYDDQQFIISNFHNLGTNEFVYAELDGDTLRIFNQVLGGLRIKGKGWVGPDYRRIDFYYETDDALQILEFFAEYSR